MSMIGDFPLREKNIWEAKYKEDKKAFFIELNERKPIVDILDKIGELLDLPYLEIRKDIFEVIKFNFEQDKWIACIFMILPQIEGIFSDLVKSERGKYSGNSINDKVKIVRKLHDYNQQMFDYFQYEIPTIRNEVVHKGIILEKDYESQAIELLYNVYYLLELYRTFKIPLLKISSFLDIEEDVNTVTAELLGELFSELEKIRETHQQNDKDEYEKIKEKWGAFQKKISFSYLFNRLDASLSDIASNVSRIDSKLHTQTLPKDSHWDYMNTSSLTEEIKLSINYSSFFKHLRKYYKSISPSEKEQLDELDKSNKILLCNLVSLYEVDIKE